MKRLTKALNIIAIVLNTIFLAIFLLIVIWSGTRPESLRDWGGFILIFGFPAVTLVTIALTFHKKFQILHSVLKIIAIILNASFLVIFIHETTSGHFEGFVRWLVFLMCLGLPVVNVLTVALTFRKGKAEV